MSATAASSRVGFAVWAAAAIGAVALHAGAGAAFLLTRGDDPDPELGAPAIEIGVELESPRGEATELPPGPDADASTAAPESVAATTKEVQPDLPKDQPVETPDPDRQAAPDPPREPPKQAETAPSFNAAPSTPSVASEATATPTLPTAPETARSVAPAVGVGESLAHVRASWQKELVAHLNHFKRYPTGERSESADIVVNLVLDESGRVASATILRSSGRQAFDQAALDMVRRADPVPKPPAVVAEAGLNFALPVFFRPAPGGR